jgi:phage shock protein E
MLNLKKFVKENALVIIGVILGATGGYLYYHFVGCASGSCAITSKPINSTVYGAIMGGLLLSLLKKEPIKTN